MSRKELWLVAGLLVAGLALRLGYAAHAWRAGLVEPFNDYYEEIAIQLIDHGRYGIVEKSAPTAAREPAYPFFIAAVYEFFGRRPFAVLVFQCLINLASCLILWIVARELFGSVAAAACLAMGAFYPYFIYYASYFYRETLLVFAVALWLWTMTRLLRRPSPWRAAAAGLSGGLCAVTLSTFLLVCAAASAWVVHWAWRRRGGARLTVVFLAAMAPLPSLWIGRNFAVFGRFIPGSTIGGYNLYTALIVPEDDRGTPRENEIERNDAVWSRAIAMNPTLMSDDGSQNAAYMKASVDFIKAHPRRYAGHVVKQAIKLWRFYPYERRYRHDFRLIKALSLLSDGWIIPLGLWGLLRRSRRPECAFFLFLAFSGTVVYALISAIVRYRLPLMLPLMLGAAAQLAGRREEPAP